MLQSLTQQRLRHLRRDTKRLCLGMLTEVWNTFIAELFPAGKPHAESCVIIHMSETPLFIANKDSGLALAVIVGLLGVLSATIVKRIIT